MIDILKFLFVASYWYEALLLAESEDPWSLSFAINLLSKIYQEISQQMYLSNYPSVLQFEWDVILMITCGVCNISANTISPCYVIMFASSLVFCSKCLLKTKGITKGQGSYSTSHIIERGNLDKIYKIIIFRLWNTTSAGLQSLKEREKWGRT